tara:strand:+ start:339 stop:1529 length:1191 start_codon:yes stop_codon:yes gene_type:complete
MADRILKPDSGNDLILQNDNASAKIEINEDGSIPITGTLQGSITVGSGKTLDVSSGTLTTSSAQKQTIVQAGPGSGAFDVSSGTFTTSTAQKQAIVAGASLTASDVGLGNVTNESKATMFTAPTFTGNASFSDNNITNVGDISLDTISSDSGTAIGVTLGSDSGDDFNVGSGKLVVEGDNGRTGIGTDAPEALFHVKAGDSGASPTGTCIIENNADCFLQITSPAANKCALIFGDNNDNDVAKIEYNHANNSMLFAGNGSTKLEINSSGHIFAYGVQSSSGNHDARFSSSYELVIDNSSRLMKTNIKDIPYGLNEINKLKPRIYKRLDDQTVEIGFVADECEIMPELVSYGEKSFFTKDSKDTEIIPLNFRYKNLTSVLTKAIQELSDKVDKLENK